MSPPGMGFTSASCSAYMTMNGVLNASVSAGSSQRAASVTCSAQRISPAEALPAWAWAALGAARRRAHSVRPSRARWPTLAVGMAL